MGPFENGVRNKGDSLLQATTGLADKLSEKMTILEENMLVLFTGFEDTTA